MSGTELAQSGTPAGCFVQDFVRGYDLTTYVMTDPMEGGYVVLDSSLVIPDDPSDTEWHWSPERKNTASGRGVGRFNESDHCRERRATSVAFDRACVDLCEHLKVTTLARIDSRLAKFIQS